MKEKVWETLVKEIRECTRCPLHKHRTKAVPGEGNLNAQVLLLGEAPGRSEDESGRPFVGAAGKLLNKLLESSGMRREEVFITNVVKCRPPNNREPRKEEVEACSVHTNRILELIKPKVIVALGNPAGKYLTEVLGKRRWPGVSAMRGKIHAISILGTETKVMFTYHPAAALYNPRLLDKLEEDFRLLGRTLKEEAEGGKRGKSLLDFISRGS